MTRRRSGTQRSELWRRISTSAPSWVAFFGFIAGTLFKGHRGWMAAATVVADAIGRDVRTVFRIVEDYERAMGLPPMVFEAMVEQKVDPTEGKNALIVEKLQQIPRGRRAVRRTQP